MAYNDQALAMARELRIGSQSGCLAIGGLSAVDLVRAALDSHARAEEALRLARAVGDPNAAGPGPVLPRVVAPVARGFRPGPRVPLRGGRAGRARACGALYRRHRLANRVANADKGSTRRRFRWYQRASDYALAAGDKVFPGPGPELHRRGPSRAVRPRRSHPPEPGRGQSSAASGGPGRSRAPFPLEGRARPSRAGARTGWPRNFSGAPGPSWRRTSFSAGAAHPAAARPRRTRPGRGRLDEAWSFATQSLELATQTGLA